MLQKNISRDVNQNTLTDKEKKIAIEQICKAECANCENREKQKKCSSCEIFKALSEVKKW